MTTTLDEAIERVTEIGQEITLGKVGKHPISAETFVSILAAMQQAREKIAEYEGMHTRNLNKIDEQQAIAEMEKLVDCVTAFNDGAVSGADLVDEIKDIDLAAILAALSAHRAPKGGEANA